jgi:putative transcriptional regulator
MVKFNLKVLVARREQDTGEKLTYGRLAEKAGLSARTISRLAENQADRVDLTTLDKLCKFFDCDVGDVLYYVPDGERD